MTAISDYFRTALLIDDRVESDYGPLEKLVNERADGLTDEPEPGLVPPPEDDQTPVHPSSLVHAFLAEDVVCSILEPYDDSDLAAMARQGARLADLVILDWLLFGDDTRTVDMIKTIAESNEGCLTVIVVFTGAPSLGDIVERLMDAASFEQADDFVLKRDDTVVLVFGKPGITLTDGEDSRTASYRDLPRMICEDLEMLFKGLMPEFAFRGINAIRGSTPRILATFSMDLDAGALTHRALLPDPDDAGSQFIRLLSSDLEKALHDARASDVWNIDSSSDSLDRTLATGNPAKLAERLHRSPRAPKGLKELDDHELAREAIANGLSKLGIGDSAVSKAVDDVSAAFGESETSNESLAVLMSSSGFGPMPPRLELGVVLRDGDGDYWVCIQPLCDSVRLRQERAFPMLPLNRNPQSPVAMIRSPEGETIRVGFDWSPYKMRLPVFAPTDRTVVATGEPSHWLFTSTSGAAYEAVTRLRPQVAAQAVHGLASAASRTGTDISEWLRRATPP